MTILKIKELRALTGISVSQCKLALEKSDYDIDKAMIILREWGAISASERGDRKCSEGRVESYIHGDGKMGVLLQIDCESDFVAKSIDFKQFAHEICLQIVASRPVCVSRTDIPAEKIERETKILRQQAIELNKPPGIVDRMVNGQLERWFAQICLLDQVWVKDSSKTVRDLLTDLIQKTGENIYIKRFVRFEAGAA